MLMKMPPRPKDGLPTKSEIIAGFIQTMALPSMWPRVLSESDYELWESVLDPYTIQAIRFAFESWIRTGAKFPIPRDIEPLCASYAEQQALTEHYAIKREEERAAKAILSPELVVSLCPEIIERCNGYYARGIDPAPPFTEEEVHEMAEKARHRKTAYPLTKRYFPNGNAVYNKALVQARALLCKPR